MPSDLRNLVPHLGISIRGRQIWEIDRALHPLEKKGGKCDVHFEAAAPHPEILDQMLQDNSQKFIFAIIQVRV